MDVEDRNYASSKLVQMAMIIAKDRYMIHNMKSSAYKKYVLMRVRGSDKVLKLVWQVAENQRLSNCCRLTKTGDQLRLNNIKKTENEFILLMSNIS